MVDELRRRMVGAGRADEIKYLGSSEEIVRNAREGAILRDNSGSAIGMVITAPISGLGRMVEFFTLRDPHLNPSGLRDFVESMVLHYPGGSPVLIIWDGLRMFDSVPVISLLKQQGFHVFHRLEMLLPAGKVPPPAPQVSKAQGRLRNVGPGDFEALSHLNAICFEGSIDAYLLASTNDQYENARRLMRDLLDGTYGRFLEYASFGLEVDGEIVGATIVTRNENNTLLADVAVLPRYQGQGHAGRLIRASLEPLLREPNLKLYLNVTIENPRAYYLYRHLGFEVKSGPYPLWARTEKLGIAPPEPVDYKE